MLQDVNPIIDRLMETFPACFSRSAPKPLKIGLGEEVMALAGVHPALAELSRTPPGAESLHRRCGLPKSAGEGRPPLRPGRATGRGSHARAAGHRSDALPETARLPARDHAESARTVPDAGIPQDDLEAACPPWSR